MKNKAYIALIAFVVVLLDRLSKYASLDNLYQGEAVSFIPNTMSFSLTFNKGIAFSLLNGNPMVVTVLSVLIFSILVLYILFSKKPFPTLLTISLGFILGGALGNIIDRLSYGYVVDFIKLDFVNFPVFNIADIAINIGLVFLVTYYLKDRKRS